MLGTVAAGGRLGGGQGTESEGGGGAMAWGAGMSSRSSSLLSCWNLIRRPRQPAPCSTG